MTARRPYGSGSLTEVRPGVYRLRWWGHRDPITGRRTQYGETFTGTKKAAQKRLGECVNSTARASGTLGELLDVWTRDAPVTASTMARYTFALEHLPDAMRAVPTADVTSPMLAEMYRRLVAQGVGRQTVRKLAVALSSAFRHGIEWGMVDRNPCRGVRPPTIERRTYVVPTVGQLRAMLADADAQPGATGIWLRLALGTGARRGEVLALRWADVDLDAGAVRITGSLGNDLARGSTKTAGSVRTVQLDADTAAALRAWHARAAERALSVGVALGADGWVVSDEAASRAPWRPDLATKRLPRLARRAGCPGVRLHDLRHAHATMLIEAGVSLRTVADRLGHTKVSTTQDIYGHVLPGADAEAAAAFGRLMG